MEIEKQQMENRLDKRLEADLGSKDRKNHAAEVEEITENFLKRYNQKWLTQSKSVKRLRSLKQKLMHS